MAQYVNRQRQRCLPAVKWMPKIGLINKELVNMSNMKTPNMQDLTDAKFMVAFISVLPKDAPGYSKAAEQMMSAVKQQQGFVGVYSAREFDGVGITLSYWSCLDAITQWKANKAHSAIQQKGKLEWYDWYQLQVCEVLRTADGERPIVPKQVSN